MLIKFELFRFYILGQMYIKFSTVTENRMATVGQPHQNHKAPICFCHRLIRTNHLYVFAKTTIILSYPSVYYFKPMCYDMIVAVLNYHSSIITIIVKNDNILCINYTIKTETVREQVHNMLKRLLFSSRQAFLLSKTACKAA